MNDENQQTMRAFYFGNILTLSFAVCIMRHVWGNSIAFTMSVCIVIISIADIYYRHQQFKRYLKKRDLEDLTKKIEELIANSDEFKRVNDAIIKHINQQP